MHHGCRNRSVAQSVAPSAGLIIYAGRYTAQSATQLLDSGLADLVAFGRTFMATPDLPARIANDWPLNPLNSAILYGSMPRVILITPCMAGNR